MNRYKSGQKVRVELHNSADFSPTTQQARTIALMSTDHGVIVQRGRHLLHRYEVFMNDGTITWFNEGELSPSHMTLWERAVMYWNNLWL